MVVLFLLITLKQDQEYLAAPFLDCLCKTGASSQSCFNKFEHDWESLSALSLDCLYIADLTPWLVNFSIHITIL